ncbi:hypothetical protein D3C78_1111810 [compost metagenome]
MYILKSNFPTKVRSLLRTFEMGAYAANILSWTVHQTNAIWTEQFILDYFIVGFGLFWCKQLTDHTARHWQQTVLDPCFRITWMHHKLHLLWVLHIQEAWNYLRLKHMCVEILTDSLHHRFQLFRTCWINFMEHF